MKINSKDKWKIFCVEFRRLKKIECVRIEKMNHNDRKNKMIVLKMRNDTTQHNTTQCNAIQYNTIQHNTIQYNTIQYNTIQ